MQSEPVFISKPTEESPELDRELDREPGDVLALMESFVGGLKRGEPITKKALDEILHRIIVTEANGFGGMDIYADETREKWEQYLDVRLKYLERAGLISSHRDFVSWVGTICQEDFTPGYALKSQTILTNKAGVEMSYTFAIW